MREPACWGQEGVWNTFRTGQITSSLEGSAGAAATALPLLPKIPGDRTNVKRGANAAARTADAFQAAGFLDALRGTTVEIGRASCRERV